MSDRRRHSEYDVPRRRPTSQRNPRRRRKKKGFQPRDLLDMKLTMALLVSIVVITIIGMVNVITKKSYMKYGLKKPFVVAAFVKGEPEPEKQAPNTPTDAVMVAEDASSTDSTLTDATPSDALADDDLLNYAGRMNRPMRYEAVPEYYPRSLYYTYTGKKALTTVYPYVNASDDYFNDALFIGDSRVEGLYSYGNIEGADFCFKEGINVFKIFTENLSWGDDGSGKLSDLLAKNKYKKIYIMLGVNELGAGYDYEFARKYSEILKFIHSVQKDAVITVMGIMNVTGEYSLANDVYNNDNICARNSLVAGYINGNDTFYLDVNPAVCDDYGGLNATYTNDGIHLSAEYYYLWVDYLKEHALQDEMWEGVE